MLANQYTRLARVVASFLNDPTVPHPRQTKVLVDQTKLSGSSYRSFTSNGKGTREGWRLTGLARAERHDPSLTALQ